MKKYLPIVTLFLLCAAHLQATPITFTAILSGPAEAPPNASPGTGVATAVYDPDEHTLFVEATFSGLLGITTVAHIHCCIDPNPPLAVNVATFPGTFPGFPVGVMAGSYTSPAPIDLTLTTSYTGGFLTNFGGGTPAGAEAALVAGMEAGRAYFNIHTNLFTGGEIRGFLQRVPEPATAGLVALGLSALAVLRRKRR